MTVATSVVVTVTVAVTVTTAAGVILEATVTATATATASVAVTMTVAAAATGFGAAAPGRGSALAWQRECPDYEAWLIAQVQRWRRLVVCHGEYQRQRSVGVVLFRQQSERW